MKNLFIIFTFLFLINCSFKPIYSEKNLQNLNISIDELNISGDRTANIYFKNRLNQYTSKVSANSVNLSINSKFIKEIKSKDSKGDASSYELTLFVKAVVSNNKGNIFTRSYEQEFEYETITNKAQLKEYENTIIQNLAENILNKIISDVESKS